MLGFVDASTILPDVDSKALPESYTPNELLLENIQEGLRNALVGGLIMILAFIRPWALAQRD